MDDYIRRKDAINVVLGLTMYKGAVPADSVLFNINKVKSADVAEVIRCQDCKHRPVLEDPNGKQRGFNVIAPKDSHGRDDETCPLLCDDGFYSYYPDDDDFCSRAERKTE